MRRHLSAETLARLAARLSEVPSGPTLIDDLDGSDFRGGTGGDITIGTPRKP